MGDGAGLPLVQRFIVVSDVFPYSETGENIAWRPDVLLRREETFRPLGCAEFKNSLLANEFCLTGWTPYRTLRG